YGCRGGGARLLPPLPLRPPDGGGPHKTGRRGSTPRAASSRGSSPGGDGGPTNRRRRVRFSGPVPHAVVAEFRETRGAQNPVFRRGTCRFDSGRQHRARVAKPPVDAPGREPGVRQGRAG